MHIVSERRLGIPQNSRDAFEALNKNGIIGKELADKLKRMVGFRNIAVHNYQSINLNLIEEIIEKHIFDFKEFIQTIVKVTYLNK